MLTLIFLILLFKGVIHIIKALIKFALFLLCMVIDIILILALIDLISLII